MKVEFNLKYVLLLKAAIHYA